jgi:Omp85 superfamily domain
VPGCTVVFGEIGQLAQNAALGIAAMCGNNGTLPRMATDVTPVFGEDIEDFAEILDSGAAAAPPPPPDLRASTAFKSGALRHGLMIMKDALRSEEGLYFVGGYAFFSADCGTNGQAGSEVSAGDAGVDVLLPVKRVQPSTSEQSETGSAQVTANLDADGQIQDESAYAPGGGLRLNAGYSAIEGISVGAKITRTNIFGPETELSAAARYSQVRTSFELGYADGNFLGSKYAFAPTLFADRISSKNFGKGLRLAPFRQSTRGVNLLLNRKLDSGLSVAFNYRWSDDSFRMIGKSAMCDAAIFGSAFCNTIGKTTSSVLSFALTFEAKSGGRGERRDYRLRVSQDLSVGGSAQFARSRIGGEALIGLGSGWNLSFDAEGGYIKRLGGDTIPLFDRFYIGDASMRGFDLRGIGPKIRPSGAQAEETVGIGGRAYYVARTELSVAAGGVLGATGLRPGVFIDAGSVFAADKSGLLPGETLLGNSAKPRISLGIGLAMITPVGRLRIDFAKPIMKQDGDRAKMLSVSFAAAI